MEEQKNVAVSLPQTDSDVKELGNKTPQKPKLAGRIRDVIQNREVYIYSEVDKNLLSTLLKEL